MNNFFQSLNWKLNRLLMIFGLRRASVHWGIVYDSVSKQPIDPAIIKFIDARSGHVLQTAVTDLTGRYGFLCDAGIYKMFVQKTNYTFPSKNITAGDDGLFTNLYHGEFFKVSGGSEVVSFNIPMDPIRTDWNQTAKQTEVKFSPNLENLVYKLGLVVFFFVFFVDAALLYYKHDLFSFILATLLAVFIILALVLPKPRLWGTTSGRKPKDGKDFILELCHPKISSVVVAKTKVFEDGKFFLLAQPGPYLLKIMEADQNPESTEPARLLSEFKINIGEAGVLFKDLHI